MEVNRKDGLILVRELAAEVKNHMDFKINAVMVSNIFVIIAYKHRSKITRLFYNIGFIFNTLETADITGDLVTLII